MNGYGQTNPVTSAEAIAALQEAIASGSLPALAGSFVPVTNGVSRLATVFVNLYAVERDDGGWVLVDTGLPGLAEFVRSVATQKFGDNPPEAIVLTHGHFDHAGNAVTLANAWDVPVYAHRQEFPYLTGDADYPPQDPTPGGAICFLSRFFPRSGINLGERVKALPDDGSVPSLPGWRYLHTPGHTAGHVSLWREADRTLIAGDAVTTTDLDAWSTQAAWPKSLSRPPTPFTPDWVAARASIERLAELNPCTLAAGHGLPLSGELGASLHMLANTLQEPAGGRYSGRPVHYAADGSVADVPPAVLDPLPRNLAIAAAAALVTVGAFTLLGRRERHLEGDS